MSTCSKRKNRQRKTMKKKTENTPIRKDSRAATGELEPKPMHDKIKQRLTEIQISELEKAQKEKFVVRIPIFRKYFREWFIEEYDENHKKLVRVTLSSELLIAMSAVFKQGSSNLLRTIQYHYENLSMKNINTIKNRKKKKGEKKQTRKSNEDLVYIFDPEGKYKKRKRRNSTQKAQKTIKLKIRRKIKTNKCPFSIENLEIFIKKKRLNVQPKKNPKNHQTSKIKKLSTNEQPKKNPKKKAMKINNQKVEHKIGKGIHEELTKKEKTGSCLKHSIILKKESELKTAEEQNINAQFKIVDNEPSFYIETTCPTVYPNYLFDNFLLLPFDENNFLSRENPQNNNSSIEASNNSILFGNCINNVQEKTPLFEGLDFSEKDIMDFDSKFELFKENSMDYFDQDSENFLLENQEEYYGHEFDSFDLTREDRI
ncbi:protein uxt [Anaeramoeba flamelloides]|uniref:Protein uxt n=1 Tax=Anaeramoeba flamelloides TaxID=1746091 RepID=A0ABQ8XYJ4_9EUKA|nr:protein uxt [Anaeramoeba flamelloides]